jgi:hypothetical protein
MIAFVNGAAGRLFAHSGALLGNQARAVLPQLFDSMTAPPAAGRQVDIAGRRYAVHGYAMGRHSASRGSLLTLSLAGDAA